MTVGPIGGRVDAGEDALSAAKRELLEESGYEADEFILWEAKQPTTKIDWVIFTFIAKGAKKVAEPELDGGEKIKLLPVSFDELMENVIKGRASFAGEEIFLKFIEAKFDPQKRAELEQFFRP